MHRIMTFFPKDVLKGGMCLETLIISACENLSFLIEVHSNNDVNLKTFPSVVGSKSISPCLLLLLLQIFCTVPGKFFFGNNLKGLTPEKEKEPKK